jgi:hypothetical protein
MLEEQHSHIVFLKSLRTECLKLEHSFCRKQRNI